MQSGVLNICQASDLGDPYRVMIVDDSAIIRGFLSRWLDAESDIEVVAFAATGVVALREFERIRPEVIILDIEMPEMDGLAALPKLVELDPDVQIIMASTLTRRNATISLKALSNGAADYIAKPESTRSPEERELFQRNLIDKVRALGVRRRAVHSKGRGPVQFPPQSLNIKGMAEKNTPVRPPINLRAMVKTPQPKAIAIGASTGGPQALFELFAGLKGKITLPIFITQHMPATFTAILAEHLGKIYQKECAEAKDGEMITDNRVYVAPGNWHMTVIGDEKQAKIRLNQAPPENYCRPSVDPMLRSLQTVYGGQVLTIMLTGMGQDGLLGCQKLVASDAPVIAQDEKTSVVWGMPGKVANAGLCNFVLPLQDIPLAIENLTMARPL